MSCFGTFYEENVACGKCKMAPQCKAIMVSDGLDLIAVVIQAVESNMPDQQYVETTTVSGLVQQMLDPESVATLGIGKFPNPKETGGRVKFEDL